MIYPNAMIGKNSLLIFYFIFRSPGNYLARLKTLLRGQQMSATRSGQVVMSVMTAAEGMGLDDMTKGARSAIRSSWPTSSRASVRGQTAEAAAVPTPWSSRSGRTCLCDLTSGTSWGGLWGGCTTDMHQLYSYLMPNVTSCIFEWSKDDMAQLVRAKRAELAKKNIVCSSDIDVERWIYIQGDALDTARGRHGGPRRQRSWSRNF